VVRDTMLKNAAQKVLLCDSSKFAKKAHFMQCRLGDVDYLVSEENYAQRFAQFQERVKFL